MNNLIIRDMTQEDWSDVCAIYKQGMDSNLATFQTVCPSFEEFDASHLKICRFVVLIDSQIAGWAALSPVSSRCVYSGVAEVSIYIKNGCKGKGLGTALFNEIIKQSEQNNIWTLQSGIMADNEPSIKIHEKCGFRMVGYREKIGCDRFGVWRDTVLMERRSKNIYRLGENECQNKMCCQK